MWRMDASLELIGAHQPLLSLCLHNSRLILSEIGVAVAPDAVVDESPITPMPLGGGAEICLREAGEDYEKHKFGQRALGKHDHFMKLPTL